MNRRLAPSHLLTSPAHGTRRVPLLLSSANAGRPRNVLKTAASTHRHTYRPAPAPIRAEARSPAAPAPGSGPHTPPTNKPHRGETLNVHSQLGRTCGEQPHQQCVALRVIASSTLFGHIGARRLAELAKRAVVCLWLGHHRSCEAEAQDAYDARFIETTCCDRPINNRREDQRMDLPVFFDVGIWRRVTMSRSSR
jgi:hypothetical protein